MDREGGVSVRANASQGQPLTRDLKQAVPLGPALSEAFDGSTPCQTQTPCCNLAAPRSFLPGEP